MTKLQNKAGWAGQFQTVGESEAGTVAGSGLVDALRRHASERPDEVAFTRVNDGQTPNASLTYGQLDRRARAIATALQDNSFAGQRIVLAFPPGLEFVAAFFGCLYAGCVAVPTYPPRARTVDRFYGIVSDSGASVALSTASSIAQYKSTLSEPGLTASPTLQWLTTDEVPDAYSTRWREPATTPDSLAMLQYTSGSTSRPKGVMLTHANLAYNARAIAHAFGGTHHTSGVFWLPAYHDMGLIGGVLVPVLIGKPMAIMAPASFLQNPFLWLENISKNRASISGGPNFAYDLCVRKTTPEQRATLDLSCWSLAFIGAEAVHPDTLDRFAAAFAPCGFKRESLYPCYGLAEATLIVTGPTWKEGPAVHSFDGEMLVRSRAREVPPNAPNARSLVGCGRPVVGTEVHLVNPDNSTPVESGHIGEVWVAGPGVGEGYWQNPRKTAKTFNAALKGNNSKPQFLRTGDLGFIHENQLYITGRSDDLIIVRGLNHHPQDIEATARTSHKLLDPGLGAAFAVSDNGTQRLVLVHEVERDGTSDLTPVINGLRNAVLEVHGLSLDVVVLIRCGTIAKTSSGKVQRHASRTAFLEGRLKALAQHPAKNAAASPAVVTTAAVAPTQPTAAALAAVCQHAMAMSGASLADITPETPIAALGLDSLQRLELVAALDKTFSGHLPDPVYTQATTVGDLANAVQKHLIDPPLAGTLTVSPTAEVPTENYDVSRFPEYLELKRHERMLLAVAGKNPYFRADEGTDDATHAGGLAHIGGRELVNFCAYDYVGMAHDPLVVAATKNAIDRYGTGAGASRLVSGEKQIHRELETALASFLGTPDAIVFVSGHATNVTTIGHLLGPGDLIVHDILAHNSILQGARLSGATCRAFAHNDWRALDTLLAGVRHGFRRVLIAIEGVYSMDGDCPDLPRFIEVKKKHKAMMLVDEAHSLGTMGKTGRGIGEYAGIVRADVELWMGTLSKSLASCGGYIAGSSELVEYLKYTTPGFVYSVGISPPNAGAALAALKLLEQQPQRVARLGKLAEMFLKHAQARGLDTGLAGATPVIPVIIGNSVKCLLLSRALFNRGINVQPILHPAVPEHATRLRFFITTNHTEEQVRQTVDAVADELALL